MPEPKSGVVRLLVFPQHAGLRIDQFLAAVTHLSRRAARTALAGGQVWRNGRPLRVASREVEIGDVIELLDSADEGRAIEALPAPVLPAVNIVHHDSWLLCADKPSGVLSQPAEARAPGELAFDEQVLLSLALDLGRPPFLRLVHRIDRLTSGLLLFARAPAALAPLERAWREQQVERRYFAVVEGRPSFERMRVEEPIARVADGTWRFEVSAHGQPAGTEIEVLARGERWSTVECRLLTGRTHQVRVHLAHLGLPVAGDHLYGARQSGPTRPLLHAAVLVLPHPHTGERLELRSPLPADFTPFLPEPLAASRVETSP